MHATTATLPPIILSSRDVARLDQLLESPALRRAPSAMALAGEIARAEIRSPEQVPGDVVTMHSKVTCVDEISGEHHAVTLVYPRDADLLAGKVSVLAPVGSALLGLRTGQRIDWQGPGDRKLRVRVVGVQYQPEAAGDFHR